MYKIQWKTLNGLTSAKRGNVFETIKEEHLTIVKLHTSGSNITNHAWNFDHKINFNGGHVIDKTNYHLRKTLESWHSVSTIHAANNSRHYQSNTKVYFKNDNYYVCARPYFVYFTRPVFIYFCSCINNVHLEMMVMSASMWMIT